MGEHKYYIVTATAPVNIAIIKYWGKRDEQLILPLNDSISFTLSQSELCATTTACISPAFTQDAFWLNGKVEELENPRIQNCLREIRRQAQKRSGIVGQEDRNTWRVHLCSANNFPTAAGLASSAAGYAAMVVAVSEVYGVLGMDGFDISIAARQGSGSACRSVLGGLVRWHKGEATDGSDSVARQIANADHWGDLHVILCVVSGRRKKTGSTEGMRRCVKTSEVLELRRSKTVDKRIVGLMQAVQVKDWPRVCDLTMADSNEMHAACLTAFPPCVYMTDTSHAVATLVHEYNAAVVEDDREDLKICYTFDAGPNACLFVPVAAVGEVLSLLQKVFPPADNLSSSDSYLRGLTIPAPAPLTPNLEALGNDLYSSLSSNNNTSTRLQYLLHTTVGDGPRILATASHINTPTNNNTNPPNAAVAANNKVAPTTNSSLPPNTPVVASLHLLDPVTGSPVYSPATS